MSEELSNEIVMTYLKQLRLSRMARDCQAVAREGGFLHIPPKRVHCFGGICKNPH